MILIMSLEPGKLLFLFQQYFPSDWDWPKLIVYQIMKM